MHFELNTGGYQRKGLNYKKLTGAITELGFGWASSCLPSTPRLAPV
jgi:hypothetical protein